ncbi:MAG: PrsW family intramembrane metalloprotease [Cyanobacteria bacterium REEB444]|nr:PrsW family intramembrane metalloprotease [Cyanobacteria bacterium REEB444]
MTNSPHTNARLIQVANGGNPPSEYPLPLQTPTLLGRDISCQVSFDPQIYRGVSRQHLEIRYIPPQHHEDEGTWQVTDLGSSNGTFVNGQQIKGSRSLQPNDHILLGTSGPELVFTCQGTSGPNESPGVKPPTIPSTLHLSQVVPILSTRNDLLKSGFLVPGMLTVLLVVGLFSSLGHPVLFNQFLGFYLALAAYFVVYRLSEKPKPWWILTGSAIFTIVMLASPVFVLFVLVFREILPGKIPGSDAELDVISTFIAYFFGAGLCEELLKALPVFILHWLGTQLKTPWKERIGVWDPLDGILIATASAVGFTLLETLGEYVPRTIESVTQESGQYAGELIGLQLLIPRILGSIIVHIAYSGYFGYFIGLSIMKPSKRWTFLAIGWLTSSLIHALWNTFASNPIGGALVGMISYAFLMAAILKARQLSPSIH